MGRRAPRVRPAVLVPLVLGALHLHLRLLLLLVLLLRVDLQPLDLLRVPEWTESAMADPQALSTRQSNAWLTCRD